MGDSTLIEFLRDHAIVIASAALVLWLLAMGIIALLLFKKLNTTITTVRQTVSSVQGSAEALRDSVAGKNLFFGIAAAGLGKGLGALFRSATRRRQKYSDHE